MFFVKWNQPTYTFWYKYLYRITTWCPQYVCVSEFEGVSPLRGLAKQELLQNHLEKEWHDNILTSKMYHNQSSKSTIELKRSTDDTCSPPHAPAACRKEIKHFKGGHRLIFQTLILCMGRQTDLFEGHKEFENVNDSRHSERKQYHILLFFIIIENRRKSWIWWIMTPPTSNCLTSWETCLPSPPTYTT